MARFTSCDIYFPITSGATSAAAVSCGFSETVIPVPPNAATIVLASAFVSNWNTVSVNVVAARGAAAANVAARITAVSVANCTVTVTFTPAAPTGTHIEVIF